MYKRIEQRQAEKQADAFLADHPTMIPHRTSLIDKAMSTIDDQKAELQEMACRPSPQRNKLGLAVSLALISEAGIA